MRFLTVLFLLASIGGLSAGEGLSITATTTSAGGNYSPSNVVAFWVETSTATFVKTVFSRGSGHLAELDLWQSKAGNTDTDGNMGATVNAHAARSGSWNMLYKNGNAAADGAYKVWFETADKNNPDPAPITTASVPGANRFSFAFQKDGVSRTLSISDPAGKYTAVSYTYTGRVPVSSNPALSISTGQTTTFTITNNAGVTPSGYQWRKGGTNIGGATASTYTINPAALGDAGSYDCVVTYPNSYGLGTAPTMTSNALTLTVTSGTIAVTSSAITPATTTVNPGATVTLTNTPTPANATGPVYAWFSNGSNSTSGGSPIAGQTLATYNPPTASAGTVWYYGTITAGGATVTSGSAVSVTVRAAPTISVQPGNTTVAAGGTANFSITAADAGFPSLTWQWQSLPPAGSWANIGGATASTYSTTSLVNGTQYRCVLKNFNGSGVTTTSNAATLTAFQAPTITADTTPLNPSALAGATVNLAVSGSIPGSPAGTLSYQWQYRSSSAGTFANVVGATLATRNATAATNGEQYRCLLTNTVNGVTATTISRTTTITVAAPAAPAFTLQPSSASVFVGDTASFTVAASGVPTPTLLWSDSPDGTTFTPIGGATGTTYTTAATTAGDVGVPRYYRCTATNGSGSATSTVATRTVTGAPTGIAYINFTSSSSGGGYAPDKHVKAAWIQRGATFIVTLGNWSGERRSSLVLWNSVKSGADAVMGATLLRHRQIGNLAWNFNPATTPDGTYTLWLESSDANPDAVGAASTTSVTGANRTSLSFTIVSGSVVATSGAGGGFTGIRISPFLDPTAAASAADGGASGVVQDAGKVASCGSGGVFALILACGLMLTLRRRRA